MTWNIIFTICKLSSSHSANLHEFQIPRELLLSCKSAHAKYVAALEKENKFACWNEKAKKRKLILEEISEIKRKNWCFGISS